MIRTASNDALLKSLRLFEMTEAIRDLDSFELINKESIEDELERRWGMYDI